MTSPVNDERPHNALHTAADAMQDTVDKASDAVAGVVKSVVDTANDTVDAAREEVSKGARAVSETANTLADKTVDTVKKYPIRTVLIAAGAAAVGGFVLGAVTGLAKR